MDIDRSTPLTDLPGVGAARGKALMRLGLYRAGDLPRCFPRDYEDRRRVCPIAQARPDEAVCVEAVVSEPARWSVVRRGLDLVKLRACDDTGIINITFFNQPYTKSALHVGESYFFYGKVEQWGNQFQMNNPVFEPIGRTRFTGRIMPVYALTAGVSNNLLAGLVQRVLDAGGAAWEEDALPPSLRREYGLVPLAEALGQIHFPDGPEKLERARRRLIFEELFTLSAGLSLLKSRRSQAAGPELSPADRGDFLALLPFAPTGAQLRVMGELEGDMAKPTPMNRLVQGDVGSGKTVLAAYAGWQAFRSGWQSALMAPTEILAEQHFNTLAKLLAPAGMRVALLTGAVKAAQRRAVLEQLAAGEIDLLVGTHALITPAVAFARLGLVIADEQHRFGVNQRSALAAKGALTPHVLVMSATPIPRTLALLIYGDLDVSIVDELPPGRTPVKTLLTGEHKRKGLYGFVRKQVGEGRQVYLVCPAVEENPDIGLGPDGTAPDLKAVTTYAAQLREEVFPDLRVGLVHGKLKAKEKEAVMASFAAGELDVLVATTVVEVGVDVPNASLMVIENAERFGLSQLHQLRGRVGRGPWQSWCVLMTDSRSPESIQRLKVLTSTTDGFKIAEEDLKLRGPGDFFGSRQHGLPQLKVADFASDLALLKEAQAAAQALTEADPELSAPEHRLLRERVRRLFAENADIFN